MFKHIVSLILAMAMLVSAVPVQVFAEETETTTACQHVWDEGVVVAPNCEETGYTTYICAICSETYNDAAVSALGHSWGDWIVTKEATADTEGSRERICSVCSKTETDAIEKLPQPDEVAVTSVDIVQLDENGERIEEEIKELTVGETLSLTALVLPENATDKTVMWSSSAEMVATVDGKGIVTGVAAGEVIITAACGEVENAYELTVKAAPAPTDPVPTQPAPVAVESIEITAQDGNDCIAPGETLQLTATVLPENATDKNVIWSSMDETVLTVDGNGLVTGIASGCTFIVAATDNGEITAQYEIAVFDEDVSEKEIASFNVGTSTFTPGSFSTTADIVDFFNELSEIQNGKCWNKNLDEQTLINQVKAYDFSEAVQDKKCADHNIVNGIIPNCYTNVFDGREQCNGYAAYLAYIISGVTDRNANVWTSKVDINNYIKGMTLNDLQPGDVIAYRNGNLTSGQHWVVVWKIENGKLYVAEGNSDNHCRIHFGETTETSLILSKMQVHSRCNNIVEQLPDPTPDMDVGDYLSRRDVTREEHPAVAYSADGNKVTVWRLPWTNTVNGEQNSNLKLGTISGDIRITHLVVNHAGNLWYEFVTETGEPGFLYSDDLRFKPKLMITLDANGGSCDVTTMNVVEGEQVLNLPTPTRSGYTFDGWFEKETGIQIQSGGTYNIVKNMTLYARWTESQFQKPYYEEVKHSTPTEDNTVITAICRNPDGITLKTGGFYLRKKGSTTIITTGTDNITGSYQTAVRLDCSYDLKNAYGAKLEPGTTYEYRLYVKDTSNNEYFSCNDSQWHTFTTTGTAVREPDASMKPAEYLQYCAEEITEINKIAIPADGKSATTWKLPWTDEENSNLKLGTINNRVTLTKKIVNHVGHIWYEYDTGSSTRGFVHSGDVTIVPDRTITLDPNGGSCSTNKITVVDGYHKLNLPTPERKSYTFTGWYTKKDGGIKIDPNETYRIGQDMTFYAHWTRAAFAKPYYSEVKTGTPTEDNVTISATSKNPDGIILLKGGFCLRKQGSSKVIEKYDDIVGSWQTAETIPCSYNLKSEYNITTLEPGTVYEFRLYLEDEFGNRYYSCDDNNWHTFKTAGFAPGNPEATISVDDYLTHYAQKVTAINRTATTVGNATKNAWKLPWNNSSDETLLLRTISGELTLIREIVNHVGNTWYEYETGTGTRGFIYGGDVKLDTAPTGKIIASGNCGFYGDNVTYTITDEGVLTIRGTGIMGNFDYDTPFFKNDMLTKIIIEEGVTHISNYAFKDSEGVVSVTIPESVQVIGSYAFSSCKSLTSIDIPDGVVIMGSGAFFNCTNLREVVIPKGLTSISNQAFSCCFALSSVTIPDSVKTIDFAAFDFCESLTAVTLPSNLTSIELETFENCANLTSITIPASVTAIDVRAFNKCPKLREVYFTGSESQWNEIAIDNKDSGNANLLNATIHFAQSTPSTGVYDVNAALSYAAKNYTDYPQVSGNEWRCSEFVMDCLWSGGLKDVYGTQGEVATTLANAKAGKNKDTGTLYRYLKSKGFEVEYYYADANKTKLATIQGQGDDNSWATTLRKSGVAQPGDCIFYFGEDETNPQHFVLCSENGGKSNYDQVYSVTPMFHNSLSFFGPGTGNVRYIAVFHLSGKGTNTEPETKVETNQSFADTDIPEELSFNVRFDTVAEIEAEMKYQIEQLGAQNNDSALYDVVLMYKDEEDTWQKADETHFPTENGERKLSVTLPVPDGTNPEDYKYHVVHMFSSSAFGKMPGDVEIFENVTATSDGKGGYSVTVEVTGLSPFLVSAEKKFVDPCANGHSFTTSASDKKASDATCQNAAAYYVKCNNCDAVSTEKTVYVGNANRHTYDQQNPIAKHLKDEATCTTKATFWKSCICGAVSKTETFTVGNMLGHTGGTATCKDLAICDRCKQPHGKLDATNHVGGTEIRDAKSATCTVDGYTGDAWCLGCQTKIADGETIGAPGHKHEGVVTPPTCIGQGYTTYTCHCGDSYVGDYVTAYGHSMGEWYTVREATPDADGEIRRDCGACDSYETQSVPYQGGNVLKLEDPELKKQNTVWINGLPYGVKGQGEDRYVEVSPDKDCFLVTYSFHAGDGKDVHTQYPTGMKAYRVSGGKITYIPELDNLLQYSGSSIRIAGKKGIRMITSLTKTNKAALTGKGLAGYKLVEYGTVLCFASEVAGDGDLVLGKPYARSNYAYKRGVADPVFASTGNLIQYTNVLVGFSSDQCKEDIAMRPYIILEDAAGSQFTLYGGTIYRSIGYIAYQNRNVFQPKTASYDYVWSIIHHVYGNKYDKDYKG